ncbi:deoxyguanosinetriphosphate triphosphohydrolase family protein [Streptomyces sp. NPDC002611]
MIVASKVQRRYQEKGTSSKEDGLWREVVVVVQRHEERRHAGANSSTHWTECESDRDRILYSYPFRRLAGVTQVAAVRERHLLHNRLTHSLKVAQIGRRMAQRLIRERERTGFQCGLPDSGSESSTEMENAFPDVVESAGLAHDMGHPPFGHTAEEVLVGLMNEHGGFEGNAQSFRIVTKLAVHDEDSWGLNLTRATLDGILKYPRYREDARHRPQPTWAWHDRTHGHKWGAYHSERKDFEHARLEGERDYRQDKEQRSAAATLMDWADDVSYATHDLYDYFQAGLMPLHTLHAQPQQGDFFRFAHARTSAYFEHSANGADSFEESEFDKAYETLRRDMPSRKWIGTRDDRINLENFMNGLLEDFMDAVGVDRETKKIKIAPEMQYRIEVLKQMTFYYVIKRPGLTLIQEGQKEVIRELFGRLEQMLLRSLHDKETYSTYVPVRLSEIYKNMILGEEQEGFTRRKDERRARAVCDYICLLTEDQALNLYECITGRSVSQGSIFGAWFS